MNRREQIIAAYDSNNLQVCRGSGERLGNSLKINLKHHDTEYHKCGSYLEFSDKVGFYDLTELQGKHHWFEFEIDRQFTLCVDMVNIKNSPLNFEDECRLRILTKESDEIYFVSIWEITPGKWGFVNNFYIANNHPGKFNCIASGTENTFEQAIEAMRYLQPVYAYLKAQNGNLIH